MIGEIISIFIALTIMGAFVLFLIINEYLLRKNHATCSKCGKRFFTSTPKSLLLCHSCAKCQREYENCKYREKTIPYPHLKDLWLQDASRWRLFGGEYGRFSFPKWIVYAHNDRTTDRLTDMSGDSVAAVKLARKSDGYRLILHNQTMWHDEGEMCHYRNEFIWQKGCGE